MYGYGPTGGVPLTEDLPLAADTVKGRTRAAMTEELLAASSAGRVRIAIGRASDFFGAGVTETTLGERVFANALAGKRADFIGNPDLPHTYSYVPDVAAGLATLGTDERAVGGVWHLPGPETVTTRAVLDLVAERGGAPGSRPLRSQAARCASLGVFNPLMRELAEMAYRVRGTVRARHDEVPRACSGTAAPRSRPPSPRPSPGTETQRAHHRHRKDRPHG